MAWLLEKKYHDVFAPSFENLLPSLKEISSQTDLFLVSLSSETYVLEQ